MASVYMDQISWVEYRQRVEQGAVVERGVLGRRGGGAG